MYLNLTFSFAHAFIVDQLDLLCSIVRQVQVSPLAALAWMRPNLEILAAGSRRPKVKWEALYSMLRCVYPRWKACVIRWKLKQWSESELRAACRQIDGVIVNRIPTRIDGGTPPTVSSIHISSQQPHRM